LDRSEGQDGVTNAVLRGNRLTARIRCQDLNPVLWHINMAQDQGQHPLADGTKAEDQQTATESSMFHVSFPSKSRRAGRVCHVLRADEQWRVSNFGHQGTVEAIEGRAQCRAIGPKLPDFDPISFADITWQSPWTFHDICRIAGGTEQHEFLWRNTWPAAARPDQAVRKAKVTNR